MAAPWIPLRINLVDDPRVCRIARAMVWPAKLPELVARRATVGALHAVWSWLDMHTEDGYVAGLTAEDIDGVAGISGFAAAMQTVGWLVIDEQGVTAPGFEQYCGTTAKRRMADARRKRRAGRRGPQELAELPSPANWSECGEGVLSGVVKIKAAGFQCASDRDGELMFKVAALVAAGVLSEAGFEDILRSLSSGKVRNPGAFLHAIVDRKLNGHANELFKALGPPPAELVELVRQKLATRLAPGTNGLQAKHGGNGGECERLTCGG